MKIGQPIHRTKGDADLIISFGTQYYDLNIEPIVIKRKPMFRFSLIPRHMLSKIGPLSFHDKCFTSALNKIEQHINPEER